MPFSFLLFLERLFIAHLLSTRPLLVTRAATGDKPKVLHLPAFVPAEGDGNPGPGRGGMSEALFLNAKYKGAPKTFVIKIHCILRQCFKKSQPVQRSPC